MRDYRLFFPDFRFIFRTSVSKTPACYFRHSFIPLEFLGAKFYLHTGQTFRYLSVKESHLNVKAGSFFFTKRTGSSVHYDKSKKKK